MYLLVFIYLYLYMYTYSFFSFLIARFFFRSSQLESVGTFDSFILKMESIIKFLI